MVSPSGEKVYEPISNIYRQVRESLLTSDNFRKTLETFNSKRVFEKLSPEDHDKFFLFLSIHLSTKTYTLEDKLNLLKHVSSLEMDSRNQELLPAVVTASGRISPRSPKYRDYQRALQEEGPGRFRESCVFKRRKVSSREDLVSAVSQDDMNEEGEFNRVSGEEEYRDNLSINRRNLTPFSTTPLSTM